MYRNISRNMDSLHTVQIGHQKKFLTKRLGSLGNTLPGELATAPSPSEFKGYLDDTLRHMFSF